MYRSLASVGIIAIIGSAGVWTISSQNATSQTTETVAIKNHMSDAERDKLMQEAIDKARKEQEAAKAKEAAEAKRAADRENEKDKARLAAEAAKEKLERDKPDTSEKVATEARQKALVEQLTRDDNAKPAVAESEPSKQSDTLPSLNLDKVESNASAYSADVLKQIDTIAPLNLDSVDEVQKAAEVKQSGVKKTTIVEKKAPEKKVTEKKSDPVQKKKTESASAKDALSTKEPAAPEPKITVERVSTKDPDANLTVKKTDSNDTVKDAEKEVDYHTADVASSSHEPSKSDNSQSLDGQVVGLMRTNGTPRLLVRDDKGRMVQVVLDDSDITVPAPASMVSIRGKNVGGANGRMVLSASSVKIKSGTALQTPNTPRVTVPNVDEDRPVLAPGRIPIPPMAAPPFGMMPGPIPMMPGPMMMPPPGAPF